MAMFTKRRSQERERSQQSTLPPPPESTKPHPLPTHPIPPRRELVFHCQLAHGSPTRDVKDFSNVKELYTKIAKAFEIEPSDIIFCTLNTPKIDMTRLLGGQIGLEDFIFTHVKGQVKTVTLTKQESSLGLTITDNGAGIAFIKRIKEGSVASHSGDICVGDMILSIAGQNLEGARHYEVARLLKELPRYEKFTMTLVEPLKTFTVAPRGATRPRPMSKILDSTPPPHVGLDSRDEKRPTLRLKSDGQAIVEDAMSLWTKQAIERVDDLLESFMGIRDSQLARVMVDLARDKMTVNDFALGIDESSLADFEFPDDFILDMWTAIDSTHTARV